MIIALGFALVGFAHQTTTVITVNGARPLCDAIMKLEKASGQPITYEDAPYLYAGDLVDVNATEFANVPHTPGAKLIKVDLIRFGGRVAYVDLVSSSFVEESLQVVGGGRMSMWRSPVAAADRPAVI